MFLTEESRQQRRCELVAVLFSSAGVGPDVKEARTRPTARRRRRGDVAANRHELHEEMNGAPVGDRGGARMPILLNHVHSFPCGRTLTR